MSERKQPWGFSQRAKPAVGPPQRDLFAPLGRADRRFSEPVCSFERGAIKVSFHQQGGLIRWFVVCFAPPSNGSPPLALTQLVTGRGWAACSLSSKLAARRWGLAASPLGLQRRASPQGGHLGARKRDMRQAWALGCLQP